MGAPGLARGHFNLALALEEGGEGKRAVAAYRAAIAADPGYAEAHHNLGNALQALGDLAGALSAYGTALRLDPRGFARIVNSLAAHPKGELWLDLAALRRALAG